MATPQEIVTGATCFSCIPDSWAALVYEFDQIRINGGGAVMTPAEIAEASKCYKCIPDQWAALLYLASQIVDNGGGGGGGGTGGVLCGSSDPVAAPANSCTIFYRTDVVRALGWNGSAWVVLFSEV